jgi:hypothetical protein
MVQTSTGTSKTVSPGGRGGGAWNGRWVSPGAKKQAEERKTAAAYDEANMGTSNNSGFRRQRDMTQSRRKIVTANRAKRAEQNRELSAFELWQLMGGGSGGGGGGGGPSRAQIQAQAAPSRARIEAMYKQYADMIASREADISKNYTTAGQNLQSIYGGAEQNINESYNAARAAQTAQLQALGLTETAPPTNTNQQAYAASILSRLGAAGMSENDAARVAAINNNLALRNAATAEGTRTLSDFDAQLANALASAGSGGSGGGGGGGGGGNFRDMLAAMTFDATQERNAYDRAFQQSQVRPTVDKNSLYNYAIDVLKLNEDQALKYAGMF